MTSSARVGRTSGYIFDRLTKYLLLAVILGAVSSTSTYAHVGSPDIYADGNAGPYRLFVTVRPPQVIPGVAEIEVRTDGSQAGGATVTGIQIAPIPLTGEASFHPPVADAMKQSKQDKQFFTGSLWIMASGSWQVRFTVAGSQGQGLLSIPVPATSSSTQGMQAGLGIVLSSLGLLLCVGVIGIVGAAARDAQLPPGATAGKSGQKRAWVAMSITVAGLAAAVWFGNMWWKGEADAYDKYVYKSLTMQAELTSGQQGGPLLKLTIKDPGWLKSRKLDDFVLDHDHLMHLYMLREPGLDQVYHLHPEQVSPGEFNLALPSAAAGNYRLYADIVHATGFPETLVASLKLPAITGRPFAGDDAHGSIAPVSPATDGCATVPAAGRDFHLPDGYTMTWNNSAKLAAKTPQVFTFSLADPKGQRPTDMALYMGMIGHAAFVKDDGTVFAHVHPSGTISMAALMMAAQQNQTSSGSDSMAAMPEMKMQGVDDTAHIPSEVSFPYGFPTPGAYRIFVQMKHGQTIETAAFDTCAGPAHTN